MIFLTPGEPAGIGPELVLRLVHQIKPLPEICIVADPGMLSRCTNRLQLPADLPPNVAILPVALKQTEQPGRLDPANAPYVLDCLKHATASCLEAPLDNALVTGPIHKGVINDAGISFSGHTGFLAGLCNTEHVVMLLGNDKLQVALQTTHIPLTNVAAEITKDKLLRSLTIIQHDFAQRFNLPSARIMVLGLNPHAGENGHMGTEEIEHINPAVHTARQLGMHVSGPVPGDTAFTAKNLEGVDVVLAMYHDQGLAPLKAQYFGKIVNTTLGLPIIRTSVDHGTALDLADLPASAPQRASIASLEAAVTQASRMLSHAA